MLIDVASLTKLTTTWGPPAPSLDTGKYWLINTKEDDQFIIRFATGSPQTLPCHVDAVRGVCYWLLPS